MFTKIEYRRHFLPHKRLRYKICYDKYLVAGEVVICYLSNQLGMPAQWDVLSFRWNIDMEEDKKVLFRVLAETEEEDGINYDMAYNEACAFKRDLQLKRRSYLTCPATFNKEWVNKPAPTHFPISMEEVIKKIADFRKCQG